jgi:hypothetical protein
VHPCTEQRMTFESPIPKDMALVLESLRVLPFNLSFS